jgi:orotidine-5'-phosphate decarboxylase
MISRRTGIILAVDSEDEKAALCVIRATSEYLDAIKIGVPLIINTGLTIVEKTRNASSLPIITDLKVMDVPHIAMKIVVSAFHMGSDIVTISGQCGLSVLKECNDYASSIGKGIIALTEFTHPDGLIDEETANHVALVSKRLGIYGIQAPGTKPHRIKQLREIVGSSMIIVSCGIGEQGPEIGSAINSGADFEIIGRKICKNINPDLSARNISRRIEEVLQQHQARKA